MANNDVTPLRELKTYPAPVDCPICGVRGPTEVATKLETWDCAGCVINFFLVLANVKTYRKQWIEHTCSNCHQILAKHHPALQPLIRQRGKSVQVGPEGGETEVLAFAMKA